MSTINAKARLVVPAAFKHPSPWDYVNFMNKELKQDLNWFWYYWLWTTDSVDGSIAQVSTVGTKTTVTVRQEGQMPSPVILRVRYTDGTSTVNQWPVDVWFSGSRTFQAIVDSAGRTIQSIQLDPACRFPDRDPSDNVWPKGALPARTCDG